MNQKQFKRPPATEPETFKLFPFEPSQHPDEWVRKREDLMLMSLHNYRDAKRYLRDAMTFRDESSARGDWKGVRFWNSRIGWWLNFTKKRKWDLKRTARLLREAVKEYEAREMEKPESIFHKQQAY